MVKLKAASLRFRGLKMSVTWTLIVNIARVMSFEMKMHLVLFTPVSLLSELGTAFLINLPINLHSQQERLLHIICYQVKAALSLRS